MGTKKQRMAFRVHIKVCFGDIDHAGIVYYPRFLHYFHVALEEFFSCELGIEYAQVMRKYRIAFPTVHLESDFRRPLRFGDHFLVEVKVIDVGRSSVTWGYRATLESDPEAVIVEGHNVTVCLNLDRFKKRTVPDWLRKDLEAYQHCCGD